MTQRDRDRLVVLRKAEKKLIGQGQAARELGVTSRQIRRLLRRLKRFLLGRLRRAGSRKQQ